MITSISFLAVQARKVNVGHLSENRVIWEAGTDPTIVEFNLGLGPCGKTVSGLYTDIDVGWFKVTQVCTDGTSKSFMYKESAIIGHIRVGYGGN